MCVVYYFIIFNVSRVTSPEDVALTPNQVGAVTQRVFWTIDEDKVPIQSHI